MNDLRFAFRQLAKAPGFTATVIITLAIAISACTVVFSIVNSIVLNPLDNPEPDRLVRLQPRNLKTGRTTGAMSATEFMDWQARAQSLAAMRASRQEGFNVTGLVEPLRLTNVQRVAGDHARVNGIAPLLGRSFAAGEDVAGRHNAIVLSHGLWQSAFGGAAAGAVKAQMREVDKSLPISPIRTFEQMLGASLRRQRFTVELFGIFSVVALLIASVGIYGVIAYAVSQRTAEFGIRMALGAQVKDVLRLVMVFGGRLIACGMLVGLATALGSGRLIESMLFQTSTRDPVTLAVITVLLSAVAGFACWLPARRATKVDPIIALRAE